ncbi:MAG: YceD family protein [Acidobacteriaceae bacterium]
MKFTVAELERQAIDFDESLAPGTIDFVEDLRQVSELHAAGRADLLKEHRGAHEIVADIRVRASLQTRVEAPCARCLEPVVAAVDTTFDLLFRPIGIDGEGVDRSITTSETEIGYYEGDGLLLEDVLREQILLALPAKTLCREDCKGLCAECGRNRNTDPCNCATAPADPRWSSLQAIRSRVKP